ncbi:hypothetical protein N7493_000604 [Penicillium malachiteum]|uniref:Uncharacterized protein n=1 Tax=Penicillium malachiteum TaxID=1324776 RepID=A0AAD6HXG8_9EURO|nr:hypothetical protein N7493_000604 [Penicillium malachiteum]
MLSLGSGSSWTLVMVTAFLATTVYAVPIHDSGATRTDAQRASVIEPRDPRIIPDTERYLADVLGMLGIPSPGASEAPSSTPSVAATPTSSASHGKAESAVPTPIVATPSKIQQASLAPSATQYIDGWTVTTSINKNKDTKPFENIQIGSGWHGGNRIQASDVPFIMDSVYSAVADRLNDFVDSSDELTLDDE